MTARLRHLATIEAARATTTGNLVQLKCLELHEEALRERRRIFGNMLATIAVSRAERAALLRREANASWSAHHDWRTS